MPRWPVIVLVLVLAACGGAAEPSPAADGTPEVAAVVPTASASPTQEPTVLPEPTVEPAPAPEPAPAAEPAPAVPEVSGAAPSGTCVNGWVVPDPGSEAAAFPLETLRAYLGLGSVDELVVGQVRYFTGPEDVEVVDPRTPVERWYVEAILVSEPAPAGRWMIRRTAVGSGIFADAPHGTTGFGPGLWWATEAGGDPFDPPCTPANGLYCACSWGVQGCSCDDPDLPVCTGPPPEVMGCLDGL